MKKTKEIIKRITKIIDKSVGVSIARPRLRREASCSGITLIALIITIVLMLILASISVNVAINGGLFEYAGEAKHVTENAEQKQIMQKAVIVAESTSKTGRITVEDMQKALNKVAGEGLATAINNGDTIVIQFNKDNSYYEVDGNGKVSDEPIAIVFDSNPGTLEGTGTETDPFIIMSIEDLVYFSQQVNSGTTYERKYIELGKTLDFNSDLAYIDPNTTDYDTYLGGDGETGLKEQLTKELGFRPIGESTSCCFRGDFDGNNNEIKNIKVERSTNAGLFGTVTGSVKISNLTITGDIKSLSGIAGGLVGYTNQANILFSNITNYCNVSAQKPEGQAYIYCGGIVGNTGRKWWRTVCFFRLF